MKINFEDCSYRFRICGFVNGSSSYPVNTKFMLTIYPKKVSDLNDGIIPFHDPDIPKYLQNNKKNIIFTTNKSDFLSVCDFVIIATPTNFDEDTNYFDTSTVEDCITEIVNINSHCSIIIKSTIPFNFTKKLNQKYERLLSSKNLLSTIEEKVESGFSYEFNIPNIFLIVIF